MRRFYFFSGMGRKIVIAVTLVLYLFLLGYIFRPANLQLLNQRWTNWGIVQRIGFVGYFFYDVVMYVKEKYDLTSLSRLDISEYRSFMTKRNLLRAKSLQLPKVNRKNVIYLQMESVDAVLLNLDYEGGPVMPFLAGLKDKSIYFKNAFDQTGIGKTVDGEFLALTSQIPILNQVVYTGYDLSHIPSLPRILKEHGYFTFSMHGYAAAGWHWKENHLRLGYDRSYAFKDLESTDVIGLGISDLSVVNQAVDKMVVAHNPFFAHIILLTNHHPYSYIREKQGSKFSSIVDDYYISARYVDSVIATLFKRLEKEHLLADTIVAIYSDHSSAVTREVHESGKLEYLDHYTNDKIPLLLYGTGETGTISRPSGLQDLAPTILFYLGLDIPPIFLGSPPPYAGDVLLEGNLKIAEVRNGRPVFEDAGIDLSTLTKLAISRPQDLTNGLAGQATVTEGKIDTARVYKKTQPVVSRRQDVFVSAIQWKEMACLSGYLNMLKRQPIWLLTTAGAIGLFLFIYTARLLSTARTAVRKLVFLVLTIALLCFFVVPLELVNFGPLYNIPIAILYSIVIFKRGSKNIYYIAPVAFLLSLEVYFGNVIDNFWFSCFISGLIAFIPIFAIYLFLKKNLRMMSVVSCMMIFTILIYYVSLDMYLHFFKDYPSLFTFGDLGQTVFVLDSVRSLLNQSYETAISLAFLYSTSIICNTRILLRTSHALSK